MPDPTGGADPHGPPLSHLILAAKVQVRAAAPDAATRRTLIDGCRIGVARIVGITAPAGYGKTTLLAEWAALENRRVGWASLDTLDDNPSSLLAIIAAACRTLSPRATEAMLQMRGVGASVLGRSAPMLAAVLAEAPEPFVLFIDDVHTVDSPPCQDALEVVLSSIPSGSQVVLASRHEQPYFARLRAVVATREIDADDLRLGPVAARSIFTAAGVEVAADELDMVVEHCEGWPTGLFLCALAVASGADLRTLAGSERFVADYLFKECFATLPRHLQEFLRRTAVLDQLSGPLCDAVLGLTGSRGVLRRLEQLNLFLVPLDRQRGWFRYHALFREFLVTELNRVDEGLVPDLHRRAADWFCREQVPTAAVEHLLSAGERARAAELVADIALPTYQHGRVELVERWLSQIGDTAVAASPATLVIAAWTAILQGKSPAAEKWAAELDRVDPSGNADDVIAFESARAMVRAAMCRNGPQRALQDAQFSATHEPEWSPWRDQALHLLGSGWLLVGENEAARQAFLSASACAQDAGNPDSVLLSEAELAILAIERGRWRDAEVHAHTATRTIDESRMEGYPTTALALAVRARVALRHGDAVGAERFLSRAMRARVHCTHVLPYLAMRVRLQLAMAYAAKRDHAAALHMFREIDELRSRRPHVGVLTEQIDQFRAKLDETAARGANVPLTPAELRLLPYLQTHLTIAEIGRRLFVSRNTVSSQVGSIYRKLGVTTRASAVDEAVSTGLLGE
ncbi:LuxR C-terminal-related transcriptional regulator [Microbacterium esteraromaticum]|uniref:LuxR C-terminal-related transcriptional regulator n=1 Tax=Microbacterium esteraromaticum TaxID=57043 RepID=UPI0028F6F99E|nr:LuxR C-terminal-related transcriptional regulator [Microbacterium esteraromaticum]